MHTVPSKFKTKNNATENDKLFPLDAQYIKKGNLRYVNKPIFSSSLVIDSRHSDPG